jgi:hypothetical protein
MLSSKERTAMTLLPHHRIHGWIIPMVAALAAALVLALPGLAHADATSQSTVAAPVTAVTLTAGQTAAPAPGTDDASANPDSAATTPTDDSALASDDPPATDTTPSATTSTGNGSTSSSAGAAGSGGTFAQPDAASWR